MHPFGGTQLCPRCGKPVYLAEQTMGPGRKLYHKPCLACTMCNKRLDSMTLLEHDQQPYCKSCHLKSFGTRDLRHANLPYAQPPADDAAGSGTPSSPTSPNFRGAFAPLRPLNTGAGGAPRATSPLPRLRPNRSLATSPISSSFPRGPNAAVQQAFQASETGNSASTGSTNGASTNSTSLNLNANPTSDPKAADQEATDSVPPTTDDTEEAEVHHSLVGLDSVPANAETAEEDDDDNVNALPGSSNPAAAAASPYRSNTGRPGIGTIPRTVPLYLNGYNSSISSGAQCTPIRQHHPSQSLSSIPSGSSPTSSASSPANLSKEAEDLPNRYAYTGAGSPSPRAFGHMAPLAPTATGSRYGIALDGGAGVGVQMTGTPTGTPRKWGAGTPQCARCAKSVYFAEQVKAAGKTYHKHCLRCVECNTSLDSSRLRDHDGDPFCVRCYGKLHGPQGSGYALLGKAGG